MVDDAISELERVERENQYLTASHRKALEEAALEALPRADGFSESSSLQALMARALWGRVALGEAPAAMLERFSKLPLYAQDEELPRQHARALCSAAERVVQTDREQALTWARSIGTLPGDHRERQAQALSACSVGLTGLARVDILLLAQAETVAEEIPTLEGFAENPRMQMHYGEALHALMLGWRQAIPTTQQNHRKAQSLVRRIRALSWIERDEVLLTRWLPELVRIEPDLPSKLPALAGFATSGALQSHYASYLATEASRAWTAPDAMARAEEIPRLPLFAQWPTMAQAYVLALGHVVGKAQEADQIMQVMEALQSGVSPNPAPALRGWDKLLTLAPENEEYRRGRKAWLARFGFAEDATVAQVVKAWVTGVPQGSSGA